MNENCEQIGCQQINEIRIQTRNFTYWVAFNLSVSN